jgi:hypothetical protein
MIKNNIIITASNAKYFNSLKTLIASIHRESFDLIDQIFVFDLGLSEEERRGISAVSKVTVVDFPDGVNMDPSDYAFKCYAVHWGSEKGNNVLWLDAGVMALGPIDEMYEIIENDNVFLVEDRNHRNISWTHEKCREIMQATDSELNDFQLSAGILGYKKNGKYQSFINDSYEFSKIKECISGSSANHRHDQSIYSILASRYNCPRQHIEKYGYYTDSNRNLNTAKEAGAVIFVHRNGHWDFNGLK